MGRVGSCFDKGLASWCTSWRGLGVNSFSEGTALSGGEVRVAGGGRLVESLVLVVCLMGVQDSGACPALDRTSVHAEPGRDLGFGEQAVGAEPFGVAEQFIVATRLEHDACGEGFAFSGAVTGGVEDAGGLGVGVGVEESVEDGEGPGVGLAGLPRRGWDRDGEAGGLPPAESHVQWMRSVLCRVTSSTSRRAMRLRSRCGVSGFVHRVGKSVARERILALCSSVRAAAEVALARS